MNRWLTWLTWDISRTTAAVNLLKSGSTLNAVLAASALIVPDQTANAAPTAGDLCVPALQWIMMGLPPFAASTKASMRSANFQSNIPLWKKVVWVATKHIQRWCRSRNQVVLLLNSLAVAHCTEVLFKICIRCWRPRKPKWMMPQSQSSRPASPFPGSCTLHRSTLQNLHTMLAPQKTRWIFHC